MPCCDGGLILDIAKAAGLGVVERTRGGLAVVRYLPLSEAVGAVLRLHTSR